MLRLITTIAASILLIVIIGACSSDGGEPDESSLRQAVSDYVNDVQGGEPLRAWGYASDSYKEKCDAVTFAGILLLADASLGEAWRDAELRIDSVEVTDDNVGIVNYDLFLDGEALGFGAENNDWIVDEGEWRFVSDDPDPCRTGDSSESPTDTPPPDDDSNPTDTPEATAGPTPEAAGSSRDNPVPLGIPVTLSDGWTVTVLDSTPDATSAVLGENSFNDPPDAGNQFFMARITATYNGSEDSSILDASFRFKTVGQTSVTYDQFSEGACGVIPDEIEDPEVFEGGTIQGTICWQIESADADSLVAFDDPFTFEDVERVWLAVLP